MFFEYSSCDGANQFKSRSLQVPKTEKRQYKKVKVSPISELSFCLEDDKNYEVDFND